MNAIDNILEAPAIVSNARSRVRKMQTLAFAAFTLLCAVDFVFRILKGAHVLAASDYIYYIVVGCVSICGYLSLYSLSSNLSSDFFSAGQIMFELFFPVAMPMIFYLGSENVEDFVAIYYLCMLMCVASIYNWSMLLNNNAFTRWERSWIMLLPMASVLRFAQFWHFAGSVEGRAQLVQADIFSNAWCLSAMNLLTLLMPIGFWALTRSRAFSGDKNEFDMPSFSPLNRYTITYAIIIAACMILL